MATDMEVYMVANMEVNKVADKVDNMVADIVAKKGTNLARRRRVPNLARRKKGTQFGERGMQKRRRRKGTQFGERVGHGDWLIGPKLFRPEALIPDLRVF